MDIGEMKHRIELLVEEDVSDGQGGYDSTLVSKGSTWACTNGLQASRRKSLRSA